MNDFSECNYTDVQTASILNRIMMAYFLNEIDKDIDLINSFPTFPGLKSMFANTYVDPNQDMHFVHMKEWIHHQIVIENFDLDFLKKHSIEDFINKDLAKKITETAKIFSQQIKKYLRRPEPPE